MFVRIECDSVCFSFASASWFYLAELQSVRFFCLNVLSLLLGGMHEMIINTGLEASSFHIYFLCKRGNLQEFTKLI